MPYSIDLDCPPGNPRPGDLLPGVLHNTGVVIDPEDTVMRLFGNWRWMVPAHMEEQYITHRATIKERITELYEQGLIRYGSW